MKYPIDLLASLVAHYYDFCDELKDNYSVTSSSLIHKSAKLYFNDPTANAAERISILEKIVGSIERAVYDTKINVKYQTWLDFVIDVCSGKQKEMNDRAKKYFGIFIKNLDNYLTLT